MPPARIIASNSSGDGAHAMEEVRQRSERAALACGQQSRSWCASVSPFTRVSGTRMELPCGTERRPGFVHGRRQQLQAEPMTFEHIDERIDKSLCRWSAQPAMNSAGIIPLEPRGLIRLDAVGRAVRLAEGVAGKARRPVPTLRRSSPARGRAPARTRRTRSRISAMTARFCLFKRAAQHVRPARMAVRRRLRRFAGCVPHKPPARRCSRKHGSKRRMRIRDRLHAPDSAA